jgi:hypothetical protein
MASRNRKNVMLLHLFVFPNTCIHSEKTFRLLLFRIQKVEKVQPKSWKGTREAGGNLGYWNKQFPSFGPEDKRVSRLQ